MQWNILMGSTYNGNMLRRRGYNAINMFTGRVYNAMVIF